MQTCEMNSVNNIWAYFWAYLDYFWASFHSPSSLQQQRQMLRSTTMKQLGLYSNNNCQQQPMSMKDLTSITTGVTFHTNMLQSHLVSSLCSIMSAASYTSTLESTLVQAHKYSSCATRTSAGATSTRLHPTDVWRHGVQKGLSMNKDTLMHSAEEMTAHRKCVKTSARYHAPCIYSHVRRELQEVNQVFLVCHNLKQNEAQSVLRSSGTPFLDGDWHQQQKG